MKRTNRTRRPLPASLASPVRESGRSRQADLPRILHVESGARLFGGARQVCALIDGLAAAGFDNVLVCPPGSQIAAVARAARIVEMPMHGDLDPKLQTRLRRLIGREAPDLVHAHSRRGADAFAGRAARAAGRPAVLTRRVDSREPQWWARWKFAPYARIAAISRSIESELVSRTGIDAARVVHIPSGVETAIFRPQPLAGEALRGEFGLDARTRLIGVAAQLIARKGHAVLFDALHTLAQRGERDWRLLCFGTGPLERSLGRRARALGLDGQVLFAGMRAAPQEWMPGLDVLVHPAWREGLGVAVLEAMSCGLPVVAAQAGGLVDAVEDGQTGLTFAPGDAAALAAALMRIMGDASLAAALGARARRCIEERFTVQAMTQSYIRLYESILRQACR